MKIKGTLLKFNDHSLPKNFVSVAVCVDEEKYEPYHAAILIRHQGINYLYHFPGSQPPIVENNFSEYGWYVYKILESFNQNDSSEIGAILQQCRRICQKSSITYSYIVDGSTYNEEGKFVSKVGLPEFGSCVGFCLNTLANMLIDVEETIVKLEDWDDSEVLVQIDEWGQRQARKKYPDLEWSLYNAFKKRITPIEYLCTSYFKDFPIRKQDIDNIKDTVIEEIREIYSHSNG